MRNFPGVIGFLPESYVSGDLSDTGGSNHLFALSGAASTIGYDFPLSSLISDFTLAAGQSATFTSASEGGGGGRTRFDNIAPTVTLKDSNGVLISGESVTLAGSPAGSTINPAGAQTTNASGQAAFTVKSTTIGTVVFTATSSTDPVVISKTANIQFVNPATAAGYSVNFLDEDQLPVHSGVMPQSLPRARAITGTGAPRATS